MAISIRATQPGHPSVPPVFHGLTAAWMVGMLLFGYLSPTRYESLLQEDRLVEWGTMALFVAAGCLGIRRASRTRRAFDGLVALFCLFVAGEEFSWGQRLLGFDAPEFFLANNFQQELTLHNLPQSFIRPKSVFMIALAGYGLVLPLLGTLRRSQQLIARIGATVPPLHLVPWFMVAILLLLWYPLRFTGEWVELLVGGLFVASTAPAPKILWASVVLAAVFGLTMTNIVGAVEGGRDADRVPCAVAQTQGLLDDIIRGDAARGKFWRRSALHKRVWTATNEGYLNGDRLWTFHRAWCRGAAARNIDVRRKYFIDPWGTPYWLSVRGLDDHERLVTVYSFGPDRRRDSEDDVSSESGMERDVIATGVLRSRRD